MLRLKIVIIGDDERLFHISGVVIPSLLIPITESEKKFANRLLEEFTKLQKEFMPDSKEVVHTIFKRDL